ncbi:MAG: 1-deoxy-D-xylulose-5-phosphate synthase [Lachnospiraceae bacterium]|nr:1-deoxy-D-xylulose-5-phosphate synthase [Lachnospiraceae bacterium]
MILEKIQQENDIKKLTPSELERLPKEIRRLLIDTVSETGGHLASNLGVVELTMALHLAFDVTKDQIVWDVGHQSYTHKILTGRWKNFSSLRQLGGISGFPNPEENANDTFVTGHSTTSLSLGLGLAWARELKGENYHVISVIGDGSLTGGMAYEAINNASMLKKNYIIVLNDNNMSISENVGGMSEGLMKIRTSARYTGLKDNVQSTLEKIPVYGDKIVASIRRTKSGIKQLMIPGMTFEQMGVMYLGPVDGHDVAAMRRVFEEAAQFQGPVLVHVLTKKGYGFKPAENHPARFHGADPFDKDKGIPKKLKNPTYTDIFSTVMRKMGDREKNVVAITAAMMDGVGLKRFHNMFPERFFDVGIAEEHAVTFAAAMAKEGLVPVVAIYSTFLQRAYDQILNDVCVTHKHVIFAVDRAGIVGKDGVTHQGVFDISYLSSMPGMTIMAPKNKWELSDMMKFAVKYDGPIAIRYPRGEACTLWKEQRADVELGKCEELYVAGKFEVGKDGKRVMLFALGSMVKSAMEAKDILSEEGIAVTVVNARFAQPFDKEYLEKKMGKYDAIVTLEENVRSGGFGEHVSAFLAQAGYKGRIECISVPDTFVQHGDAELLKHKLALDGEGVAASVEKLYKDLL